MKSRTIKGLTEIKEVAPVEQPAPVYLCSSCAYCTATSPSSDIPWAICTALLFRQRQAYRALATVQQYKQKCEAYRAMADTHDGRAEPTQEEWERIVESVRTGR